MATKIWVGTDSGNLGKYGTAANWSPSGVPLAADDVFFVNSSQAVTADFDQSAVALTSFTIDQSYTGAIGTESTFLEVQATTVRLGAHEGAGSPTGSGRLNLDFGSATGPAITVFATKSSATDTDRDPLRMIMVNAGATLTVHSGLVSIADNPDQTATLLSLDVIGGTVTLADGVTITTVSGDGGTINQRVGCTTLNVDGATVNTAGSGAITTVNTTAGTFNSESSGTITTITHRGGTIDFTGSTVARTVTNYTFFPTANLKIDTGVVTLTNNLVIDTTKRITIQGT